MALINRLDSRDPGFASALSKLLAFEAAEDESIDRAAAGILADVRPRATTPRCWNTRSVSTACRRAAPRRWRSGRLACRAGRAAGRPTRRPAGRRRRVRAYHERQRAETWTYTEADGTLLGQQVTPLDRVGLYVPGGKAAIPRRWC